MRRKCSARTGSSNSGINQSAKCPGWISTTGSPIPRTSYSSSTPLRVARSKRRCFITCPPTIRSYSLRFRKCGKRCDLSRLASSDVKLNGTLSRAEPLRSQLLGRTTHSQLLAKPPTAVLLLCCHNILLCALYDREQLFLFSFGNFEEVQALLEITKHGLPLALCDVEVLVRLLH